MVSPNKFVEALKPYEITPQDVWVADQRTDLLKLDWNEAPYGFEWYKRAAEKILQDGEMLAWYPDYLALELTKKIADFCSVTVNNVLVFPGSDVALETICRGYLTETDVVITVAPTYDNFSVFVAQTGAALQKIEVIPPKEVTLVLDYDNLVISRTFSKAFGLAGLRLGYVCAGERVLNSLNKIRNGKNVIMLAQKLGVVALDEIERLHDWVDEVRQAKLMVYQWCDELSLTYFKSEGNFVMLEVHDPTAVCSELRARGIYVRNRDSVLPGYIRVTIGSVAATTKLLNELMRSLMVTRNQIPNDIRGL